MKRTDWHKAEAFNDVAQKMRHLKKGDRILVKGSLRNDNWEGRDGVKRYGVKIRAFTVQSVGKDFRSPQIEDANNQFDNYGDVNKNNNRRNANTSDVDKPNMNYNEDALSREMKERIKKLKDTGVPF